MSAPGTDAAARDVVAAGPSRRPTTRRVLWVRASVVVALAALVAAGWWWTHPRVLSDGYGTFGFGTRPVAERAYVGLSNLESGRRDETITITAHEVHYSRNEADARSRLLVCVPRTSYGDAALGTGLRQDVADACRSLRPVRDGTRLRLDEAWPPAEYLVLEVAPTRAGKVTVDGLELSYRRSGAHLFQQGTQRVDDDVVLRLTAT